MIKLKKIVAVAMAATMIMGLSMTASAMNIGNLIDSPTDTDDAYVSDDIRSVSNENSEGESLDPGKMSPILSSSQAAKSISTKKRLESVLVEAGLTPAEGDDVEYVPIYATYLSGMSKTRAADGSYEFTFALNDFRADGQDPEQFKPGDVVYAMLETGIGTGAWEVLPCEVSDKGEVRVTVNHDGAFVLFKVLDSGEVIKLQRDPNGGTTVTPVEDPTNPIVPVNPEDPGNSQNPANGQNANGAANANGAVNGANGVWTSPKTGEF